MTRAKKIFSRANTSTRAVVSLALDDTLQTAQNKTSRSIVHE